MPFELIVRDLNTELCAVNTGGETLRFTAQLTRRFQQHCLWCHLDLALDTAHHRFLQHGNTTSIQLMQYKLSGLSVSEPALAGLAQMQEAASMNYM